MGGHVDAPTYSSRALSIDSSNRAPRASPSGSMSGLTSERIFCSSFQSAVIFCARSRGRISSKIFLFCCTFRRNVSVISLTSSSPFFASSKTPRPMPPNACPRLSLMFDKMPSKVSDCFFIISGKRSFMPSIKARIATSASMPRSPIFASSSLAKPRFLARMSLTGTPSCASCMTSCPMSFPVVRICPKTKARWLKPSCPRPSPDAALPSAVSVGRISSAS